MDCSFISWNRIAQNANYPNAVTTWNGFYRWNCNENKMHTYTLLTPKKNARKWTVISEVQRKELPTTSTHTLKISMPRLCYYARFYVRHCMEIAMKLSKPCGWKYLVLRIENFHLLDSNNGKRWMVSILQKNSFRFICLIVFNASLFFDVNIILS